VEVVAIEPPDEREWDLLVDGEQHPWGPVGEDLEWEHKQRFVGVRGEGGRLIASAGVLRASVCVGDAGELDVVGLGGVFVTQSMRGRGLMAAVVGAALKLARELGPEHAMLFCRPELAPVYAGHGFEPIAAPVRAMQPAGEVVVPAVAMHLALVPGARWPEGEVQVLGLPF
jgi:GNAT superfamily N-acetyltransferase